MAKYIAGGGVKGNLQQMLTSVESSQSSKEISSEVVEGYMSLGVCQVCFLFPLKRSYELYIRIRPLL